MKKRFINILLVLCVCLGGCTTAKLQNGYKYYEDIGEPKLIKITNGSSVDETIQECIPSVVAISCVTRDYQSIGSGVCVGDDGLILTNYHVVSDSKKIYLYLINGEIATATLLWGDKSLDLALLKSNVALPWLEVAQMGSYEIGEEVIAVGTPLDLNFKHSVTKGVISAINRTIQVDNDDGYSKMTHLLQHDASINPGNSGGPLLNTMGQVIGINTIKVDDAEGMGFAIVCDTILPVIKDYVDTGTHTNGYLGVFGYDSSLDEFGSKNTGLKIVSISENSPLKDFNVSCGDIITNFNDVDIKDYLSLKKELYKHKAGESVKLKIKKTDDSYYEISVKLIEN